MRRDDSNFLRVALIAAGVLLVVVGGVYGALYFIAPASNPEISLPSLLTPSATARQVTPTLAPLATPVGQLSPTPTATRPKNTATPTPEVPVGGIVYALSPDVNSVGWVQGDERGNHFGESFVYAGLRDKVLYYGAMQFDLSFIPNGSTIFLAELELTGLDAAGLTDASSFTINILTEDIDPEWSRHDFEAIENAVIDETLEPVLAAADLGEGQVNTLVFNASQRSIIEQRLENNSISFRIDSLAPDLAGWFGWDSGYGEESRGQSPTLRVGVLPPVATETTDEAAILEFTPTITPSLVMITSTPTPENNQTAAAIAVVETAKATTTGTPTALPLNYVTPIVVTETPTPQNTATALYWQAEATAAVIAFGPSTPTPPNLVIATPMPTETATPIFTPLEGELPPTATPGPSVTVTPFFIPSELIGKIAFRSNRPGTKTDDIYVINPDGSGLALLGGGTGRACWPYYLAQEADAYSADGRFRVFTKDVIRYRNVDDTITGETIASIRSDAPGVYWYDSLYKTEEQLTQFGAGIAYGGVWSPVREQIAFVSTESQNDEIWVTNYDGSGLLQVTRDEYAWWDKHPSWSPDGQQIVFHSNRTGHNQIFVMNADGSSLYSLSRTGYDDYEPVWIKYPGVPVFEPDETEGEAPYLGSYGQCSREEDINCAEFTTPDHAQAYYNANKEENIAKGLTPDPYGLDADNDGVVCEE